MASRLPLWIHSRLVGAHEWRLGGVRGAQLSLPGDLPCPGLRPGMAFAGQTYDLQRGRRNTASPSLCLPSPAHSSPRACFLVHHRARSGTSSSCPPPLPAPAALPPTPAASTWPSPGPAATWCSWAAPQRCRSPRPPLPRSCASAAARRAASAPTAACRQQSQRGWVAAAATLQKGCRPRRLQPLCSLSLVPAAL